MIIWKKYIQAVNLKKHVKEILILYDFFRGKMLRAIIQLLDLEVKDYKTMKKIYFINLL